MAWLRTGGRSDLPFLRQLAREAFGRYGDYDRLLSEWARTPGVELTIAEEDGQRAGLTLLGFFEEPELGGVAADLLAIAVAPPFRRRGLGRELLQAALARARGLTDVMAVRSVRLTVAEANAGARRLFEEAGFTYAPDEDGRYPRGQRALRMRLPLDGR